MAERIAYDPDTGEVRDSDIGLYTQDGIIFTDEIQNNALRHLVTQANGELLHALSDGVKEIVEAIQTGQAKQGKIQISLAYTESDEGSIKCISKVKIDLPVAEASTVYFPTTEGALSRQRPADPKYKAR